MPTTAMMYRFLAPLLSAQFINVATLRPRDMRSLPPLLPPRPRFILLRGVGDRTLGTGSDEAPA